MSHNCRCRGLNQQNRALHKYIKKLERDLRHCKAQLRPVSGAEALPWRLAALTLGGGAALLGARAAIARHQMRLLAELSQSKGDPVKVSNAMLVLLTTLSGDLEGTEENQRILTLLKSQLQDKLSLGPALYAAENRPHLLRLLQAVEAQTPGILYSIALKALREDLRARTPEVKELSTSDQSPLEPLPDPNILPEGLKRTARWTEEDATNFNNAIRSVFSLLVVRDRYLMDRIFFMLRKRGHITRELWTQLEKIRVLHPEKREHGDPIDPDMMMFAPQHMIAALTAVDINSPGKRSILAGIVENALDHLPEILESMLTSPLASGINLSADDFDARLEDVKHGSRFYFNATDLPQGQDLTEDIIDKYHRLMVADAGARLTADSVIAMFTKNEHISYATSSVVHVLLEKYPSFSGILNSIQRAKQADLDKKNRQLLEKNPTLTMKIIQDQREQKTTYYDRMKTGAASLLFYGTQKGLQILPNQFDLKSAFDILWATPAGTIALQYAAEAFIKFAGLPDTSAVDIILANSMWPREKVARKIFECYVADVPSGEDYDEAKMLLKIQDDHAVFNQGEK